MLEERRPTISSISRSPTKYSEREKAALAYAEAITWRLETDDAFWERLHAHFTEPELVELGCFIALTMGQQSWLRLLNIDHHQVMAGTDGLDGARLRGRRRAREIQGRARLLGEARGKARRGLRHSYGGDQS